MSDMDAEYVPDESEQLDQLDPEQSLVDRGLEDPLDEGYVAPDGWSAAEGFGNTAAEMRQGETLEQRLKQEVPDVGVDDDLDAEDPDADVLDDDEVGDRRSGRLVAAGGGYDGEDTESDLVGEDVGIDGAAASAEEAAVHVVDESETDAR